MDALFGQPPRDRDVEVRGRRDHRRVPPRAERMVERTEHLAQTVTSGYLGTDAVVGLAHPDHGPCRAQEAAQVALAD
jgi:hypothetical protein